MSRLWTFLFTVVLVLSSFVSVSRADRIGHHRGSSCHNFYAEKPERFSGGKGRRWYGPRFEVVYTERQVPYPEATNRRYERLAEPKAIGDGYEKPYKPKGRTIELKEAEVSNQCQTYECYLFSIINYINIYNKNQRSEQAPLVSEEFLVAHKFLEHIKEALKKGIDDPTLIHDLEGGFPFEAVHLTRTVGLVPKNKAAWTPLKPLAEWDTTQLYKALGKRIPILHKELARLAEQMGSWQSPEVIAKYNEAYKEMSEHILKLSGPLPESFTFEGQNFTPHSFELIYGLPRHSIFTIHDREMYDMPEDLPLAMKEAISDQGGVYKKVKANRKNLLDTIRSYLEQGLPVVLDLNWKDDGHSMLVTGIEVDDQDNIVRFKVMNSWGPTFGNKGFAWYEPDDVWKNVTGSYRFDKEFTQ